MFFVISAFTFVIANVARIFRDVSTAVNALAVATVIETFLVSACVMAGVRHSIGNTFVRRPLKATSTLFEISRPAEKLYRCAGSARAARRIDLSDDLIGRGFLRISNLIDQLFETLQFERFPRKFHRTNRSIDRRSRSRTDTPLA